MEIKTTQQAEKERIARRDASWAIEESISLVPLLRRARDLGWAENKVQVRKEKQGDVTLYLIEPYEEGCGCHGIVKYRDYFG